MTILFLFVLLFALMFIGVPIAVSLGLAGSGWYLEGGLGGGARRRGTGADVRDIG